MTAALVALGSNVAPRRRTLHSALDALALLEGTRLLASSDFMETAPVDAPPGSGLFLNGACLLETELSARTLLDELLRIEHEHGRTRSQRNAPRSLDLDLILYGQRIVAEPGLVVPHPRAHERRFVLEPAAAIAPDMRHPRLGLSLGQLARALQDVAEA